MEQDLDRFRVGCHDDELGNSSVECLGGYFPSVQRVKEILSFERSLKIDESKLKKNTHLRSLPFSTACGERPVGRDREFAEKARHRPMGMLWGSVQT